MFLKTALLLTTISMSALAEYRFTGTHPYSIHSNSNNEIILKLCYDNFKRCTGEINIGDQRGLKLFLQENIWRRRDVNIENYELVLKESLGILKNHKIEVARREKKVKQIIAKEPKLADSLKDFLADAKVKVRDANYAIENLTSGKKMVDEVLAEVDRVLSNKEMRIYPQLHAYNFEHYQWTRCGNSIKDIDCFQSGLQFFIDGKSNILTGLLSNALKKENSQIHLPQALSSGIQFALLTTDHKNFGKSEPTQIANEIPSTIGGDDYTDCLIQKRTGTLSDSKLSCEAFGKNWRYPTLKELRDHQAEILSIMPEMNSHKFIQTMEVREFNQPGASHLRICRPIYYNITTDKSLNNVTDILRGFSTGRSPKEGTSGVCVCTEDC